MITRCRWASALLLLTLIGCAATPGKVSQTQSVSTIDAPKGFAVDGYDPVAYFTDQRPVRGSEAYTLHWQGARWKFSSAEHRTQFVADPSHYAPQYGGYCAFAVANGTTAHGSPHQWAIVNDRLYLNNNALAKALWDRDRPGNIRAADVNWPAIPKKDHPSDAPPSAP